MKTTFRTAAFITLCLVGTGCSHIPNDAIVRGLAIGATPWTPTINAEVIATGKAAANLTASERLELLSGQKADDAALMRKSLLRQPTPAGAVGTRPDGVTPATRGP